jgi:hypothetical protein
MDYSLSLTRHAAETLQAHLLGDRSREQMAISLCGVNRLHHELRLLVRDVILLPPDAFRHQSASHLELKPEVQAFIHQRARQHGLIQVDWHSHPGSGDYVAFSSTDDHHEAAQAAYLAHRMEGVPYGSVVVNDNALDARLWITRAARRTARSGESGEASVTYRPQAYPLQTVFIGDLNRRVPTTTQRLKRADTPFLSPVYDRQVRAFGQALQHKLGELRVGLVGVGGLGSAMAEYLARMGVRDWVLVDPDNVELTNLNRLVNATVTDAQKARPKVTVARSAIRQANHKATVRALQTDVFDPKAQRALKACDLLIIATDNHSSRMALNRLAAQYLIPLVHVGFNISLTYPQPPPSPAEQAKERAEVSDVSGEFVLPDLGCWCLQCAGIIDAQQAAWELAPAAQREVLRQRGYVADTPAPAVRHLDGLVAALAAAEIHNLAHTFKPQQRYLTYDAMRTELVPLQVTPSSNCSVCSPDDGVLGLGDLEAMPDYRRQAAQLQLPPAKSQTSLAKPLEAQSEQTQLGPTQLATPKPVNALPDRRTRTRRLRIAMDQDDDLDWL